MIQRTRHWQLQHEGSNVSGKGEGELQTARKELSVGLAGVTRGAFAEALDEAMALAAVSIAPRTERAYAEAWANFCSWAEGHDAAYLPAPPAVVAAYLAFRSQTVGKSSLRISLAALAYYHRRSGHIWSASHPIIASVMKGILRTQKRPVRPAAALTSTEVKAMLATCGADRGGRESLAGLRDRTLLLTAFASGLRRSELVALDHEDLLFTKDGLVLTIRQSKGDQEGEGAKVGIAFGRHPETCPVAAMRIWLRRAKIDYGPIFMAIGRTGTKEARLKANGVWWILRKRAELAGITVSEGERLSPHGLRAGFITEAYLNGALDEQVMHHARQKNIATTRGYRNRVKVVLSGPARFLDL